MAQVATAFHCMHRTCSENSPTTRPNWSFELLGKMFKRNFEFVLPRLLNEKFRRNSVRFSLTGLATNNSKCRKHRDFLVDKSSENSATTKSNSFLNRLAILNKYQIISER